MAGVDGNGNGHFGGGIFDDPHTVETLQRMGNGSFPIGAVDLGPLSIAATSSCSGSTAGAGASRSWRREPATWTFRTSAARGLLRRRPPATPSPEPARHHPDEPDGWPELRLHAGSRLLRRRGRDAEGSIKPATDVDLDEAEVTAATIAVWMKTEEASSLRTRRRCLRPSTTASSTSACGGSRTRCSPVTAWARTSWGSC